MPGQPVKVGPFAGGLNSYSGPTSIGDNEATVLQNFNLDMDGSLVSRPPVYPLGDYAVDYPDVNGAIKLLNWFINTDGTRYLIVSFSAETWARNEETGVWTLITNTFNALAAVQYDNKIWLVTNNASKTLGYWTPLGGFTAVASMPKGNLITIYKERLFISGVAANPNRVYFSNPADFTTWQTSINFFDAKAGDGEVVNCLYAFQDMIAIFKTNSTYLYSYDSNPSRGAVRLINGNVGVSNDRCVVEYENSLYIHHKESVYQISNWSFTLINLKVNFNFQVKYVGYGGFVPTLSILYDHLVVRHYDSVYAFNLRMGVWSEWTFDSSRIWDNFLEVPRVTGSTTRMYYAGCRRFTKATVNRVIYTWIPDYDAIRNESMTCTVVTKTYDFNVPYSFKRLFWWGADVLTKTNLTYKLSPQVYSTAVTHQALSAYKHNQITGTHLRPLDIVLDVTNTLPVSNSIGLRMFVKFLKSLRFRQVYFSVSGTTDGTATQGPIRVYSLSAFVDNKQVVPKQVS